jgi:hypothetical protein
LQLRGIFVAVDQLSPGNLDITDDGGHHSQDHLDDRHDPAGAQ